MAASSAVSVCDALDCPRVPALNCVTRTDAFTHSDRAASKTFTVNLLTEKLKSAKEETERIRAREEAVKCDVQQSNLQKKAKISIPETQQKTGEVLPGNDDDSQSKVVVGKQSAPSPPIATDDARMNVVTKQMDNSDDVAHNDTDEDDDFPTIVDCGPDADDV
jgi:hypothetical protein